MPITSSAKKALHQSIRHRERNLIKKESYKRAVKELRKLASAKKTAEAEKMLGKVFKTLDKAAKANVIKKNKASRLKSRLAHLMAKSTKTSS